MMRPKKIHTAVEADIEELGSTVRSTDQVGNAYNSWPACDLKPGSPR